MGRGLIVNPVFPQMLRPEEVEMLVCGSPTLDLHELRKVTEYDEYRADDRVIQ